MHNMTRFAEDYEDLNGPGRLAIELQAIVGASRKGSKSTLLD
jgi:hypothetical protein